MYNSEHGQDRWLNENVFNGMRGGVFVEFGAIDGLLTSNSLFFERELGWSGLCVEPIPKMFKKLKKNRSCICENYAISDTEGKVEFLVYKKTIGWSGIRSNIEPQHMERMESRGGAKKIIKVRTIPLNHLLLRHSLFHVDYMTIDVEGAEEQIVKTIDFGKFNIRVLDIENNFGNYNVEEYLRQFGYEHRVKLEINDIFVREPK